MAWEVVLVDEVADWFMDLARYDPHIADRVEVVIDLLAAEGPGLGRPIVDGIKGSQVHNMKELRPGSVRVLFAFDPRRRAVLLVAGDKAGRWEEWYDEAIPIAEQRYQRWIDGDYAMERK